MASRPSPAPFVAPEKTSTFFHVGGHVLCVSKLREGRWTCTVDAGIPSPSFMTQAEAWEAGVREAARLDHPHLLVPDRE
jgi:hypothetical protein